MGVAASRTIPARESGRRLSRQARRDQLVAAAIPLLARHGPADLSLDDVAKRAGVTRNLLYHYFPGGRSDLVSAAVDVAERQLLGESRPHDIDQAVSRLLDHALAPTHAWRIHRMARALPALTGRSEATAAVVGTLRDLTGAGPSRQTELALHGYVEYAEAVLDRARVAGVPRPQVVGLLARMLRAAVAAE